MSQEYRKITYKLQFAKFTTISIAHYQSQYGKQRLIRVIKKRTRKFSLIFFNLFFILMKEAIDQTLTSLCIICILYEQLYAI